MFSPTTIFTMLVLLVPLHQTDPASELAEMELIMTSLYPFPLVLNPRVGRHQLAARVARIFDLEYSQAVSSTLIGPALTRLGSHWSRASECCWRQHPAILCHNKEPPRRVQSHRWVFMA